MKMDPSYIKDKIHMSQNNEKGLKARIEFLQSIKYNEQLQFKIKQYIDDIEKYPDFNYGELNFLCDKYGSDKGSNFNIASSSIHPYSWLPHTYTNIYETLFRNIRYNVKYVFECGIGTDNEEFKSNMSSSGKPGASLRMWQDYFINADIYGADIDKSCLFSENKIKTGYIDQTSATAIEDYFKDFDFKFDVMIDDGLHTGAAALCLFKNSIKYLSDTGIYCIEDLPIEGIEVLQEYFRTCANKFVVKYVIMQTPILLNNNMIIIRRNPQTLVAVDRE